MKRRVTYSSPDTMFAVWGRVGRALRFDHKTLFALLSWLTFAILLIGRYAYGWRGRTALRFTLTGFVMLLLAYVGSRFVLEVVLHRGLA